MKFKLLTINPGSTSTKIAVFENEKEILSETLRHSSKELEAYKNIYEQFEFRKDTILKVLKDKNFNIQNIDAVVGRGGLLKPIVGGTYKVNEKMLKDLKAGVQGEHASNLGGIIANSIAEAFGVSAYIVDPVVVDEMEDIARFSGIPELPRKSIFHALNQKAVAKRYAKESERDYEDLNIIVAHMGGGVSVGAHKNGKIIDVNNALDGEGAFSPERSGNLPSGDLVRLCFSGKYTEDEILKKITGKGGFVAYHGTNNALDVQNAALEGDYDAKMTYNAMGYQVAKDIGSAAAVLDGKVDCIILTGGIAYNKLMTDFIAKKVSFIAPITIYPGEDEMLALAEGTLRVLSGQEEAKKYK
ncbi:butyrate kinase [Clostridium acetobutylicum]|uniref:Butyrate kinase 2 n=1 Tax=Clostridium acetobutylicum (strain ATCC 824 / DSM 792 / JCM 1419 / IAM 19013 / LMG 5710 / NBRC 13948 / NRRL B-527 / VKM B-1787 / 2291 / W) TaxID=272562 RepID=BUK2_CLOAB|nr:MULTISPECIES: butyrate kinase [Clostridium]Q97II1.1 RecName: Full=Butyrate kinase 2; Short=BK 2; AltName: Full=BKII [Clostridium acetobutylicum ATCC 824]AAK79626.1 Butyrate kinase, buk [Clostridium acetobutylicum ATCC 824]ADZ20710.1 butyrate kinase [Clostridium acetobutylicum EA 2018]AEI31931.1 butyrate kinase [Clostridium acetobutylicum DSM 1731]AWV79937.1 butyrate kinase [Clostridium acetobutylicum]MBC2394077.1 butyrate kinase [Clostridium acetobutylicum]